MDTTTLRASVKTREALKTLARASHEPMSHVLERAVEEYRRRQMMAAFNEAYAALRADPEAWQELQDERAILEGSLPDHLDKE